MGEPLYDPLVRVTAGGCLEEQHTVQPMQLEEDSGDVGAGQLSGQVGAGRALGAFLQTTEDIFNFLCCSPIKTC